MTGWHTGAGMDDLHAIGAPERMPGTAIAAIASLRSLYPNPTNAQALAALDGFAPQGTASAPMGVPANVAESYFAPHGVLPRMRLLAWGWTKKGDKLRSVDDPAWWSARYAHKLWDPLWTLADQMERAGVATGMFWDAELAGADSVELSRSMSAVVQDDLPPVNEAPCPRYLIPPTRGMLPILNPSCLKLDPIVDPIVAPLLPKKKDGGGLGLVFVLLLVAMAMDSNRRGVRR